VWFATLPTSERPPEGEDVKAFLRAQFGAWHAPIPALLDATAPDAILRDPAVAHRAFPPFPSSADANAPPGPPVTLVGDAGHGVDPILAQGAGVAVEDAYHLACALGKGNGAGRGGDVVAAIRWVTCWVLDWIRV
jgi:2-polyprenyl-6-methoxyphenol hydroxylase-like FAD-dependent oxidoreductase